MPRAPFHHGGLRAELLERAETVLRERGVEQLSLRALARDAGVSHGAPRSHFIDRAALLDALAERGFDRLASAIDHAVRARPPDQTSGRVTLEAAGRAYLDFATENPALLDLMFAAKATAPSTRLTDAAARLFGTTTTIVTTALGLDPQDTGRLERLTLLLSATVQGVSTLVASGRVPDEHGGRLLDDAIGVFIAGAASIGVTPWRSPRPDR